MAEPGNELAARAGGWGHFHASHVDCEEVIDVLKTAFVQGRLNWDEFDQRVGRALASPTYADLAILTADIPARLGRARRPIPARESVSKKAIVATACTTAAFIGLFPVVMMSPPFPSYVLPAAMVWFVLSMAVPTGWLALLNDWLVKRSRWRSAQRLSHGGARGAASQHPVPASFCG